MTKWSIYSYLKRNNGVVNEDFADMFMNIKPLEIQAGIEEYETMQKVNSDYYDPIDWGVK